MSERQAADLLPTATMRETGRAVGRLLRPYRMRGVVAFGVLTLGTAVGLLAAPLLGRIVDLVATGQPVSSVTAPVVGLVTVGLAQGMLVAAGLAQVARLGETMLADLRERFVARALHLPMERIERAGSGDLTARVTGDVRVVADGVREALPELGRAVLTIGLTLVGLAVLDWRFLVAALLAAPIQLYTVRWYGRRALPLYAAQRVAAGARQHQLLDSVGGAATVRAFGLSAPHLDKVGARSRSAVDLALRAVRLQTRFYSRLNLAEFVGLGAVLATGFWLVRPGEVSVGAVTAAALYFHNLFNPINAALGLVDDAQAAAASLARLVGVADLPVAEVSPTSPGEALPMRIVKVSYAYTAGGRDVLSEVDLDVAAGERVALVGATGAGKTTLAKLAAGLHRPASGSIAVGGADLDTLPASPAVLVTQEVHVFAGTLADDLRLARPGATDAELADALALVGATEWARPLLDTVVGDGGHPLTAAQAQQLALARLALADPPVAVLDEATAEAGSAGARQLEAAAARVLAGRTALVVAHRLTQAATADRVVVLDAGRVVASGTHDELVSQGGVYADLWSAWSGHRSHPPGRPATEDAGGTGDGGARDDRGSVRTTPGTP